eukprot:1791568-Amphidinium_carterae.1
MFIGASLDPHLGSPSDKDLICFPGFDLVWAFRVTHHQNAAPFVPAKLAAADCKLSCPCASAFCNSNPSMNRRNGLHASVACCKSRRNKDAHAIIATASPNGVDRSSATDSRTKGRC